MHIVLIFSIVMKRHHHQGKLEKEKVNLGLCFQWVKTQQAWNREPPKSYDVRHTGTGFGVWPAGFRPFFITVVSVSPFLSFGTIACHYILETCELLLDFTECDNYKLSEET